MTQLTSSNSEQERERLIAALASVLNGDQEAASWVLERQGDKVDLLKDRFPEPCLALLSFDVDKIKEFVFTTAKPLEVQGASAMIKDLEKDGRFLRELLQGQGLPPESVIFSGGGTGLLLLPAQGAKSFAEAFQKGFAEHTGTGTCSVVWQVFAPHELITGPEGFRGKPAPEGTELIEAGRSIRFGELIRLLADRLREIKEEKATIISPPLPGWLQQCQSCGREAASTKDRLWQGEKGEEPDCLCLHCKAKRDKGREERHQLEQEGRETAVSIEDIVRTKPGERGYFAVLYADVNNLGQTLFELESLLDYALFSQAVREVMTEAVEGLISEFNLKGRYQAPVVGGDDLLLLLPAQKAPGAAKWLFQMVKELFPQKAAEIGGTVAKHLKDLNISIGFAIVPAHFPIHFAVDYAEELLRSAKKGQQEHGEPCVDYLVLKDASPLSLSVEGLREGYLKREGRRWALKLTRKPVTAPQFCEMLKEARRLRVVPRAQLQQVETLLQTASPKEIQLNLRYQWLRLESWKRFLGSGEEDEGQVLRKAKEWLKDFILVRQDPESDDFETSFLDLLELYEFSDEEG
jgi:hypothetical protein